MKNRKIERKNARKEKKMRRNMFYQKKNINLNDNEMTDKNNYQIKGKKVKIDSIDKQNNNELNKKKKIKNVEKNAIKKMSSRDVQLIRKEEIEIKRYEKKLKLNKRKKKGTLPQSFHSSGLAYILDVVDNTNIYDDNFQPIDSINNNQNNSQTHQSDEEIDSEPEISEKDISLESDSDGNDLNQDYGLSESDNESHTNSDDEKAVKAPLNQKLKEDIYGFLRDSSGRIVKENKGNETTLITKETNVNQQLLRQIRGSLNRLTVNNMLHISSQIEQIFKHNSRHAVTETLWICIRDSVIDLQYSAPVKLTSEISILIAILHTMIGDEVGGHAIHSSICHFDTLLKQIETLDESKTIDNSLLFILNLYVCGLIDSVLVYDIIDQLCQIFNEKCIQLINTVLNSVGFILRKDNPIKMKELILKIHTKASNIDKNSLSGNRISYVLDSLIAIKNNNMNKLKGYGVGVHVELIENTLKSNLKKSRVNSIPGRYSAVLQSSHWYSYTQNMGAIDIENDNTSDMKFNTKFDEQLNDRLCRALKLNTPLRKTILMALSSCNDYIDAGNRLISIGKKQFSEVINVLMHICIHEKNYNPFYLHLFHHLSKCDRKYKIALDFSIRDKITELESLEPNEGGILAQLIFELLKLNVLSITCLKVDQSSSAHEKPVVHFSDMNENYVQFIKHIITSVLNQEEDVIEKILSKIPNKDSFATAIRLFINCFIGDKHKSKIDTKLLQIRR